MFECQGQCLEMFHVIFHFFFEILFCFVLLNLSRNKHKKWRAMRLIKRSLLVHRTQFWMFVTFFNRCPSHVCTHVFKFLAFCFGYQFTFLLKNINNSSCPFQLPKPTCYKNPEDHKILVVLAIPTIPLPKTWNCGKLRC